MKRLTLIRHAKSSWDHPGLPDFDRPLNERGLRDVPLMAGILGEDPAFRPNLVVSSPAARAIATAQGIAPAVGVPATAIQPAPTIYEAPVAAILKVVQSIPDTVDHAVLVGHNPGFQNTANHLLYRDSIDHLPTLGIIDLRLLVDHWHEATHDVAELIRFIKPRDFK